MDNEQNVNTEGNAANVSPSGSEIFDAAVEKLRHQKADSPSGVPDKPEEVNTSAPADSSEKEYVHPGRDVVNLEELGLNEDVRQRVQERIDYLYKQVKGGDQTNKIIREQFAQQSAALQTALDRLAALEGRNLKRDAETTLTTLMKDIQEARDVGDVQKEIKLLELYSKTKNEADAAFAPPVSHKPVAIPPQKDPGQQYAEIVIGERMNRKDENGNPKYPYLNPNDSDHDRAAVEMAYEVQKYVKQGKLPSKHINDILDAVDKVMISRKTTSKHAPVLDGASANLGNKKNNANIQLSSEEMRVAKALGMEPKKYWESKRRINKATGLKG